MGPKALLPIAFLVSELFALFRLFDGAFLDFAAALRLFVGLVFLVDLVFAFFVPLPAFDAFFDVILVDFFLAAISASPTRRLI